MHILTEHTRRLYLTSMLLLGGPILLGVFSLFLVWRTGTGSLTNEETILSKTIECDVQIAAKEYPRPHLQRLVNVEIFSSSTDEPLFFCPEIYILTKKDLRLLNCFAGSIDAHTSIDLRTTNTNKKTDDHFSNTIPNPQSTTNNTFNTSQKLCDILFTQKQNNGFRNCLPNIFGLKKNRLLPVGFNSYQVVIIPRLYSRQKSASNWKSDFLNLLQKSLTSKKKNNSLVSCFIINQIILQSEQEYQQSSNSIDKLSVKSASELNSIIRTATLLKSYENPDDDDQKIRNKVLLFTAEEQIITDFRAISIIQPSQKRFEALFGIEKFENVPPYYFSVGVQINGQKRFEFNASDFPIPVSFVASFFPFFNIWGNEGMFTGHFVSKTTSVPPYVDTLVDELSTEKIDVSIINKKNDKVLSYSQYKLDWITQIDNFHLKYSNLSKISANIELPNFSGEISDLSLEKGDLFQGIITGIGSIKIKNGSIPLLPLKKLCHNGNFKIEPPQSLSLQFANDEIPFNELELLYQLTPNGLILDSPYHNKIIAFYKKGKTKYGIFLSQDVAGKVTSYSQNLGVFIDEENGSSFWTPFIRKAINHLPVCSSLISEPNQSQSQSIIR